MDFKNVILMTDLDGTLLTDDKRIDARDLEAIARFREKGGLFTAATGRGIAMARSVIEKIGIDIPCVIFNGAAVYDFRKREFLWHSDMPPCAADYIRILEGAFPDIGIEILHAESVYVTDYNQTVAEHMAIEGIEPIRCTLEEAPKENWLKVLIAYPPERIGEIIGFTQKNCAAGVNWVHSSPMYYEMLPEGISKGTGTESCSSGSDGTIFLPSRSGTTGTITTWCARRISAPPSRTRRRRSSGRQRLFCATITMLRSVS